MGALGLTRGVIHAGVDPDGRLLDRLVQQSNLAVVPSRPDELPDERLVRRVQALRRSSCAVVILPSADGRALRWWLQQPGVVPLAEMVA